MVAPCIRNADIARSGPFRRLTRQLRNYLGSAAESLRDMLALVFGRVQEMQDRHVAAEGADTLTKLGGSVLTEVSSAHARCSRRSSDSGW